MTNTEKKSLVERFTEVSKKLDIVGMGAGMAMIAFGFLWAVPAAMSAGGVVAGTSAATYVAGEEVSRWAKRRRENRGIIYHKQSSSV